MTTTPRKTIAYIATAIVSGKPAGVVGIFRAKSDYRPYRSAPAVRWKRVYLTETEAARIFAA